MTLSNLKADSIFVSRIVSEVGRWSYSSLRLVIFFFNSYLFFIIIYHLFVYFVYHFMSQKNEFKKTNKKKQ